MARRRKKTTHHRRRRMSGIGGSGTEIIIGVIVGNVASKYLQKAVGTVPALSNPLLMGGVKLVGGFILSAKAKKGLLKGIGYGIATDGATTLLTSFGVLSGVDDGSMYHLHTIRGTDMLRPINGGTDMLRPINGMREPLQSVAGIETSLPTNRGLSCLNGFDEPDCDASILMDMTERTRRALA